jgi:hypothetical protein
MWPIFSTFVWKFSHLKEEESEILMYIDLHVKYPLSSSDYNKAWILTDFLKILKDKISLICHLGTEGMSCGHMDGRTWQSL